MSGKIIITRPLDQGREFAEQIISQINNVEIEDIIFEPMLEIIPIDIHIENPDIYDGIIVTSVNAIHVIRKNPCLKDIPFYCVGDKTAKKLENSGVKQIKVIAKTSRDLMQVVKMGDIKNLLYLRGKDISFDLTLNLKNSGITVTEAVCYEAKKLDKFTEDFSSFISSGKDCLITFFSRRTAENFVQLLSGLNNKNSVDLDKIHILPISDSVLECLNIFRKEQCYVSDTPDIEGMLTGVGNYCSKS